jgi:hypothetical protein
MSRRNHQHGGHPQRPEGTHNRSPEELAAINETLKSFADEYGQRIDNNAGRETYRFWIELVTVLGVLAYTGLTIGLLFTSQEGANFGLLRIRLRTGRMFTAPQCVR